MSNLFKKYLPTTVDHVKIKLTIYYTKETTNWATSQPIIPGYRLSAVPVTINGIFEESGGFTGFLDTILPCNRQSKKRLEEAIGNLYINLDKYIQYFKERDIICLPQDEFIKGVQNQTILFN